MLCGPANITADNRPLHVQEWISLSTSSCPTGLVPLHVPKFHQYRCSPPHIGHRARTLHILLSHRYAPSTVVDMDRTSATASLHSDVHIFLSTIALTTPNLPVLCLPDHFSPRNLSTGAGPLLQDSHRYISPNLAHWIHTYASTSHLSLPTSPTTFVTFRHHHDYSLS